MPSYDPASGITYGEYLRNKGIQVNAGRSAPRTRETRDENGRIVRTVTERTDSGVISTVRNRSDKRGDHQDVHVHAPLITGKAGVGQ